MFSLNKLQSLRVAKNISIWRKNYNLFNVYTYVYINKQKYLFHCQQQFQIKLYYYDTLIVSICDHSIHTIILLNFVIILFFFRHCSYCNIVGVYSKDGIIFISRDFSQLPTHVSPLASLYGCSGEFKRIS